MGIGINGFGNLQENIVKSLGDRPAEAKDRKKEFGNYRDTFEHDPQCGKKRKLRTGAFGQGKKAS